MPISETPFEETVDYKCTVTLSIAKNQGHGTPSITEFHNELYEALRNHYNKPMTPFYVSAVSVFGKTLRGPNGESITTD